jgi:ketosteroid isomerase-like protein
VGTAVKKFMKNLTTATFIIAYLMLICGCQQSFKQVFTEASEIDKQLVNYALPENGGVVYVSQDTSDHPASTLTNGVASSENWNQGEGWESQFDGEYEYGGYMEVGERERLAAFSMGGRATRQRDNANQTDYSRDLYGGGLASNTSSEVGWVIIQLTEEELVTRVIVHTVDSEKYPANQYGVSDFAVQYWTPHAHGWKSVDRIGKKIGEQHNSIRNNKQGRVAVRFKPVRTSRIRLLIRLTNDTETYDKRRSIGYVRGMLSRLNIRSMRGTIRLTEIEIYGLEKKDEIASVPSSQDAVNEQLLDEIFAEESTAPASSDSSASTSEEFPLSGTGMETNPLKHIEDVIRRYASAYTNRDLSALMATISPNYSRDGENYEQLRGKMAGVFRRYTQIDFSLQRLQIQDETGTATADADYVIVLTSAGSSPSTFSGKLFFALIESQSGWQILSIDTQGR